MAMQTVENPAASSLNSLNGMFVGKFIHAYGTVKENADRLTVNLYRGSSSASDIALHLDIRFGAQIVVRNSRESGEWRREEREGGFPRIARSQLFGVTIECRDNHFRIRVNSFKIFAKFDYRSPLASITHVSVNGDAVVKTISSGIDGLVVPIKTWLNPTVRDFPLPFRNIKNRGVTVTGRPSSTGRFNVNFTNETESKIYLHVDARMSDKVIVRNTRVNGNWQSEERNLTIPFPFEVGVPMTMEFRVNKVGFVIRVNGFEVIEYKHRLKALKDISKVTVRDDLTVDKVAFIYLE